MLRIQKNRDAEIVAKVSAAVKANDGYCPCRLQKIVDTKCMCKEFREQDYPGECHCGLFIKV